MGRRVLRRLAQAVAVVYAAVTLTFVLLHLAPGDPIDATIENPAVTPAQRDRLRRVYGLDRPVPEQYALYLRNVVRGELGLSVSKRRPVRDVLADALPHTLTLMGATLLLSFPLGIALGAFQALHRGRAGDRLLGGVALLFYSLPDFWLALMAVLVFALRLRLLPPGGAVNADMHDYMSMGEQLIDRLHHLALPALTLTLLTAAGIARFQRAALLDVLGEDFVRTASAKGVPRRAIVWRHLLRNAVVPTVTLLGFALPALVGGSAVVERVFSWPGLGLIAVNAIGTRDYFLVTGAVIVGSAAVAIGSLLADALHALLDPRVRRDP